LENIMSSNKNSREHQQAADQGMVDGITKHKAALPASFPVGAKSFTPDDVSNLLQERITTAKAVVTADANRTAAVKADRDKRAETKLVVDTFRRLVIVLFLQSPDTLADFSLKAPKVPQKTSATKAKAASKGKATREMLGTKGKQQKKTAIAAAEAASEASSHPAVPASPAAPALPAAPERPAKPVS
jgi:hypothetical protein